MTRRTRFLLGMAACAVMVVWIILTSEEREFSRMARDLDGADVEGEAREAIRHNDLRFVGKMGFGPVVPDVPIELQMKYGVRMLPRTGDVLRSQAEHEYNHAAVRYAERYNRLLLKEVAGSPKPTDKSLIDALSALGVRIVLDRGEVSVLDLEHAGVLDAEIWDRLKQFEKLEILILGDKGRDQELATVGALTSLQDLRLNNSPITGAALGGLRTLKDLRSLMLYRTLVDDSGMEVLSSFPKLETLGLLGTALTDKGLEAVGKITHLKWLDLRQTKVTDEGIRNLTALPDLRYLAVDGAISDGSVPSLLKIASLRELGVRFSRITEMGELDLRKGNPHLEVTR